MQQIWNDTFTDADATLLQSHTPELGSSYDHYSGSGNATIQSNKCQFAGGGIQANAHYDLVGVENRDLLFDGTVNLASFSGVNGFARIAYEFRSETDFSVTMAAGVYKTTAGAAAFVEIDTGFSTVYDEAAVTWNAATDYPMTVVVSGNTIQVFWNGVLALTLTNPVASHTGLAGLDFVAKNATITLDNFSVTLWETNMIALKTGQWNAHREGVAEILKIAGQALCDGTALTVTGEIRLFTSANAPGCDDEVADYTEATFSGYAPVLIDSGGDGCTDILEIGTNVDGVGQIVIDQQAWTEGSPATITETVNGAYLVLIDGANELLLGTFVFDNPVGMAASGDVLKVAGFMLLDCQMV